MADQQPLSGLRLLIADDDRDFIDYLGSELRRLGARDVVAVVSGDEALDALTFEGRFDLVLTDHRMPAPSGAQLLAMARTAGCRTPFLIVTGYPGDEIVESVSKVDAAVVVGKPFDILELVGHARDLIDEAHG